MSSTAVSSTEETVEPGCPGGFPLDRLAVGQKAVVRAYQARGDVYGRLRELGLTRGTVVLLKRLAPFGDPMELVVRGYNLSIRKKDARAIWVEAV